MMNFRMTKQRKAILKLLDTSKKALNVDDIAILLDDKAINLSTIYRSLDLFLDDDLIKKILLHKVPYYYLNRNNNEHYFVCEKCHQLMALPCFHDHITLLAKQENFEVYHHEMIVYGLCENCR